jgi:hypothetical protein
MRIRKSSYGLLGLIACFGVLCSLVCIKQASAAVNVNINIGPPVITVAAPSEMVLIPGSGVYFVIDGNIDIFFYNGYWWCHRGKHWYRAASYNGPWKTMSRKYVPTHVYRVPNNYRSVYGREQHIPYGQFNQQRNNSKQFNRQANQQAAPSQGNKQQFNKQANQQTAPSQGNKQVNKQKNQQTVPSQNNKQVNKQKNQQAAPGQDNKQDNNNDHGHNND